MVIQIFPILSIKPCILVCRAPICGLSNGIKNDPLGNTVASPSYLRLVVVLVEQASYRVSMPVKWPFLIVPQ